MAQKVADSILYCKVCKRETMQYKNTKEMSWLMHLVLAIFTAAIWLIIWFFIAIWHILTKPIGGGEMDLLSVWNKKL